MNLMYLTWFDSNSWLIEIGNQQILLDPWLVGPLVFGNAPWFFQAQRSQPFPIPDKIDLILLSQGLPDHAHPPTLKALDRNIPVVGSAGAAKVVQELGYHSVTALAPDETFTLNDQVKIQATLGSPIGPLVRENGYLMKDLATGTQLYYEPHGYHSPTLQQFVPIDVVITPVVDLNLPVVGAFIKGGDSTLALAQQLKPQVIVPTTSSAEVDYSGVLATLIQEDGSPEALRQRLAQSHLETRVLDVKPGDRTEVQLVPQPYAYRQ
jgi:L-ascorbate metabolism protein UlaG (beta-lactamase superfamily)